MLRQLRQTLIHHLWEKYRHRTWQIQLIEKALKQKTISKLPLDHFAIIDLPGPCSGIAYLSQLFAPLGFTLQGNDYLPTKQNDFAWMREDNCLTSKAIMVLPQVVIADFRLDALPADIKKIIIKYAAYIKPPPLAEIQKHVERILVDNDAMAIQPLVRMIDCYLSTRDWPLPTTAEFRNVQEYNDLLAWVLIFGRQPNHFTLSIHLLTHFHNLNQFNEFIENELGLKLNHEGGVIKGGKSAGIAQSSTIGLTKKINLVDGEIELPTHFIEFVWRYPKKPIRIQAEETLWDDFFTGFIADHANHVIESLTHSLTKQEYHCKHPEPNDYP